MSARNKLVVTLPSDREIAMTRDFDAPRALVWEMFTNPDHIRQWWGCKQMEMVVCETDVRVGGTYRFVGKMPDGTLCPFRGEYREIQAPERVVFTEIFDIPVAQDHPALVTTTFTEKDGKTTIRVIVLHDSKESRDAHYGSGMEHGAAAGYDQIEVMLGERDHKTITITREFSAPRAQVWQAFTDPAVLAKWFGPGHGWTNPRVELDVRIGGAVRIDMRGPDGKVHVNRGVYHDLAPQRLVAFTLGVLDDGGNVVLEGFNSFEFEERGARTQMTFRARVIQAAPGIAELYIGNMEAGWNGGFDQLRDLLAR
jgi:uncharacterized protein YndB with AHSA1/START domain